MALSEPMASCVSQCVSVGGPADENNNEILPILLLQSYVLKLNQMSSVHHPICKEHGIIVAIENTHLIY